VFISRFESEQVGHDGLLIGAYRSSMLHHWLFPSSQFRAQWVIGLMALAGTLPRATATVTAKDVVTTYEMAFFNSKKAALRQSTITPSNQPLFFSLSTSPLSRFLKKL
jgi:hypothetical protein